MKGQHNKVLLCKYTGTGTILDPTYQLFRVAAVAVRAIAVNHTSKRALHIKGLTTDVIESMDGWELTRKHTHLGSSVFNKF